MEIAYRLRDNTKFIAQVQKATLTTDTFGIEQTHGLFGSEAWWANIANGKLRIHTLRGTLVERFMGSMGDWPEIRVRSEMGEESCWTREVNNREQDALYMVGRNIQIDYVLQRHRKKNSVPNEEHKVVVEIRVEAPLGEDIPGEYQRLLAAEIAQQVGRAPILNVLEASYRLAELGRTPGVMSAEIHSVFVGASTECERKLTTAEIAGVEARWKERVVTACRELLLLWEAVHPGDVT